MTTHVFTKHKEFLKDRKVTRKTSVTLDFELECWVQANPQFVLSAVVVTALKEYIEKNKLGNWPDELNQGEPHNE